MAGVEGMYERYQPIERIFVDREGYLEWMNDALIRSEKQSVVLHLRGIGGIGKTALIDHWQKSVGKSILLDCSQVIDFYDRLDSIARESVQLGFQLRRFDLLWSVRLRFVKGVEPASDPGRSWAYDVIRPLPFIGSMVSIAKAIQTVSSKITPILRRRFGDVASWLQTRLGEDYSQRLLEVLWKDPYHAEFLFFDALLEDLNDPRNRGKLVLMLVDHFENVDDEHLRWRYGSRQISEAELWYVFLSSLDHVVSVTASRRGLPPHLKTEIEVEQLELTELDEASCREFLSKKGVTDMELQTRITSVSGGNPFALNTICDLAEISELSLGEIESLRATTLEQVRIKIWRRIFDKAEGLSEIIDRAGLIPFFDRRMMNIIFPSMKSSQWNHLTSLSFVYDRMDGTWELHDLARDLVVTELGQRLPTLAGDVADALEKVATAESDMTLLGMALSAKALTDEREAIEQFTKLHLQFDKKFRVEELLTLVSSIAFTSDEGRAELHNAKAYAYGVYLGRVAEAEESYLEALELLRGLFTRPTPPHDDYRRRLVISLSNYAVLLLDSNRSSESNAILQEAIRWSRKFTQESPDKHSIHLVYALHRYADYLFRVWRQKEAVVVGQEAIELMRTIFEQFPQDVDLDTWVPSQGYLMIQHAIMCLSSSNTAEAEETLHEALRTMRDLENIMPKNLVNQAFCLSTLAYLLVMTDRPSEAEEKALEALAICRDLEETMDIPALSYTLGFGLDVLGVIYERMKRIPDAEKAFGEEIAIYRELYEKNPKLGNFDTALPLNNLGILLRDVDINEAENALRESLEIRREYAEYDPDLYFPAISTSLINLAILLRRAGNLDEAKTLLQESLQVIRRIADNEPDFFDHSLTTSLNNLGVVLAESGEPTEAEVAFKEALRLRRDLAEKSPDLNLSRLASTLNNYGVLLSRRGDLLEAREVYQEALEIWRPLAEKAPQLYQSRVNSVLINLGLLFSISSPSDSVGKETQKEIRELGVELVPGGEEWVEDVEYSLIHT
jgi:tetratricopeptide (TPR) repeat protein